MSIETTLPEIQTLSQKISDNISDVIIGKQIAIELTLIGLFCQGHLLIEDVPGVGKTMLARSLAQTLGCSFKRIQFTPDILPSDIIGVHTYHKATGSFEFQPGPIMAQIVLIDQVNRAAPKAQAALLEAMEERQITINGVRYSLPHPFIVLATENQIEGHGIFPLSKGQLDRFFLRIQLGYPEPDEEIVVISRQQYRHPIESLKQTVSPEELFKAHEEIKKVHVSSAVERYIVELVNMTRRHPDTYLGGSPRSSFVLYRAGQARAAIHGRAFVLPDDIKALALPALGHRILLSPRAHLRKQNAELILQEILESTPIPGRAEMDQNQKRKLFWHLQKRLPVKQK